MWTDDDMDQPEPEPEPDYDAMTDEEFEAYLAAERVKQARRFKFYADLQHSIRGVGFVRASFKVEDGKVAEVTHG